MELGTWNSVTSTWHLELGIVLPGTCDLEPGTCNLDYKSHNSWGLSERRPMRIFRARSLRPRVPFEHVSLPVTLMCPGQAIITPSPGSASSRATGQTFLCPVSARPRPPTKCKSKPEPKPGSKPEPEPEPQSEHKPEPKRKPAPEPKPELKPQSIPESFGFGFMFGFGFKFRFGFGLGFGFTFVFGFCLVSGSGSG